MYTQNRNLYWDNGKKLQIVGAGGPEGLLYEPDPVGRINKLIANGGNSIYVITDRSGPLSDGDSTQNPFINNDAFQGVDQSALNLWISWFDLCSANDIVIYLILYDDSTNPWNDNGSVNLSANEQAYIDALINTFGGYENLIWGYGEEVDKTFNVQRVATAVSYIKARTSQLVAIHQNSSLIPKAYGQDIFACQAGIFAPGAPDPVVVNANAITAYNNSAELHVGLWEIQPSHGDDSETSTRQTNWAALMGSTSVMVLMWDIDNTSVNELAQSRYAQQFFEVINTDLMSPSNIRAANDTEFVLSDSSSYVAYGRTVSNMGITSVSAGDYALMWMDVVSGQTVQSLETVVVSGDTQFPKPAQLGSEVALSIVNQSALKTGTTLTESLNQPHTWPTLYRPIQNTSIAENPFLVCVHQLRSTKVYFQEILVLLAGTPTQLVAKQISEHIDVVFLRPQAYSSINNRAVGQEQTARDEYSDQSYDLAAGIASLGGQMTALRSQANDASTPYNETSPLSNGQINSMTGRINNILGLIQ